MFASTVVVRSSILTLPSLSMETLSLLVILSNIDSDFSFFEGLSIDNDLSTLVLMSSGFVLFFYTVSGFFFNFQVHVGG